MLCNHVLESTDRWQDSDPSEHRAAIMLVYNSLLFPPAGRDKARVGADESGEMHERDWKSRSRHTHYDANTGLYVLPVAGRAILANRAGVSSFAYSFSIHPGTQA